MTLSELTTLARREQERQAAITYEAARNGGVYDPTCKSTSFMVKCGQPGCNPAVLTITE